MESTEQVESFEASPNLHKIKAPTFTLYSDRNIFNFCFNALRAYDRLAYNKTFSIAWLKSSNLQILE
jgi:hypothetical protein